MRTREENYEYLSEIVGVEINEIRVLLRRSADSDLDLLCYFSNIAYKNGKIRYLEQQRKIMDDQI